MVRFCELPSRTASADKFLVPVITVVQWAGQQGETVDDETKSEVVSTNPDTQVENVKHVLLFRKSMVGNHMHLVDIIGLCT